VNIPPGVKDGSRIRLSGQGEAGRAGGPAGDLFLKVKLRPDPVFKVDGADVFVDLDLAPWEAALGATVRVPTLDGEIELNIPEGSSSGRKFRLRGRGLGDGGRRGDQYVRVRIAMPGKINEKEKELWRALAEESGFRPRE